jgi:hypothetical protein
MGRLFEKLVDIFNGQEDEESGDETTDVDAIGLSHVGKAAYEVLRTQHEDAHHVTWDVTMGKVIGEMDQTPKGCFGLEEDPPEGHSDWLPEKIAAIMERTNHWCDVMVRIALHVVSALQQRTMSYLFHCIITELGTPRWKIHGVHESCR